jgi:hypothetical protein
MFFVPILSKISDFLLFHILQKFKKLSIYRHYRRFSYFPITNFMLNRIYFERF